MKHESMAYPEALRYLAQKYNIEVEEDKAKSQEYVEENQERERLFLANEFAYKWFQEQLFETDMGKSVALTYFQKRDFKEATLRKFGLGYAPDGGGGAAFTRYALSNAYKAEILQKAGLTNRTGDRDFFRDRVMFAIHNLAGRIVAFAGRTMRDKEEKIKYLNTPETEIYHKTKILYGAFQAKTAIRKQDECYLTEGYADVITLHQNGVENVVASSGTSLTNEQLDIIKRFTKNLTILYDGDPAGIKAALRGMDMALEADMDVYVVLFPDRHDPDSYMREFGATAFEDYVKSHKQNLIEFKAGLLLAEAQNDPLKKAQLLKDIVSSVAKIPDQIKRSIFMKTIASRWELDEQIIIQETNKLMLAKMNQTAPRPPQRTGNIPPENRPSTKPIAKTPPPSNGGWDDLPPGVTFSDDVGLPPMPSFDEMDNFGGQGFDVDVPFDPMEGPGMQVSTPAKEQTDSPTTDSFQEKDITRVLMEFGDKKLEGQTTVGAYIIAEMIDLLDEFDSPLYAKIISEYGDALITGRHLALSHWTSHTDPLISSLAAGFGVSDFVYSENWEKRFDILLITQKKPEENFIRDTISAVNRLKMKKVQRMLRQNQEKLRVPPSDETELLKLVMVQRKLKALEIELAKELRTVVVR